MERQKSTRRVNTLELTCRRGNKGALRELLAALDDPSPTIRTTAAECLGGLGSQRAVPGLLGKLHDHYREVRLRVTESLGTLLEGKNCPEALIRMLQDPDALVRIEAVQSLENIGDKSALRGLRHKLTDRSALVRGYAAVAVARLGGVDEVHGLEERLEKERSPFTRACLFEALHYLGNHDVLSNLLVLLCHKSYRIRCATANILRGLTYSPSERELVLRHLRKSLRCECTRAAKSSLRASLRALTHR